MIVKNLTRDLQELQIFEFIGDRMFTIYVEGNSSTELRDAYVPHTERYDGIFQFISGESFVVDTPSEESVEDTIVEEEVQTEVEDIEVSDSFICDICGAEFGSARGLNSHKNRSHSDDINEKQ